MHKIFPKKLLLRLVQCLGVFWLGMAGPTVAQEAVQPCSISAWSNAPPPGLSIHTGPDSGTPVIGSIPPPIEFEGQTLAAEVTITGHQNGWFRLVLAELTSYGVAQTPYMLFEGEGWVSGASLGLLQPQGST